MEILNELSEKLLRFFLSLKQDDWVKWIALPNDFQDDCDKFNGCYFIVKQMPKYTQHPNCKCRLKKIAKPIPNITAKANCDIRKFTEYVFSDKYDDGKKELFENWGYSIQDSAYLQYLYTSEAIQKYCDGEYIFRGTNQFCPLIEITLELPLKNGKSQSIKTGWILLPKGEIKLATPFSGFGEKKGE